MRGNNSFMWMILQPVEVIELIHQLAANVGCHLHLQPRNDFSSWRNWNYTKEELEHYRMGGGGLIAPPPSPSILQGSGHAPHVNDMAPHADVGAKLPHPEKQPGMSAINIPEGEQNGEAVAVNGPEERRAAE